MLSARSAQFFCCVGGVLLTFAISASAPGAAALPAEPERPQAQGTSAHNETRGAWLPAGAPATARGLPAVVSRGRGFDSVQVNVDADGMNILGDAANEPSIAVDPTNPSRMVIGWRQFDTVASGLREAGWAYSHDAGRTWTFPGVLEEGEYRSDPVLAADAEGAFYYYSLTELGASCLCHLFVSRDGGQSWESPVDAFGGDKPWMVVDRSASVGRGHVYCTWVGGDNVAASRDGGATFESFDITAPWVGTLTVGSGGELFAAGDAQGQPDAARVRRSINARNPTGPITWDLSRVVAMGGAGDSGGVNVGGLLGQIWIVVDTSGGATEGNLYVAQSCNPPTEDPLDVRLARSVDGGAMWEPSRRLNDDPNDSLAWQWFGTLSIAPSGRLDVIWYDTRNDPNPGDPNTSEVYYTRSDDGGVTWSANVPISPRFNHFLGRNAVSPKLGDYIQMTSDDVGANLAYAATFNGEQDIWFLRIGDYDCNGNGIGDATDLATKVSADINGNETPDECDCLGDSDGDFDVDLVDLARMLSAYLSCDGDPGYVAVLDVDGDGCVSLSDVTYQVGQYGRPCP